ncbi:MerR family transcriptional regulator [Shouchella miscanthi]|uniref:MerR family transcriptional regulator n=1 Tax=Shouchella miscanthi TaxID=2598861 RepID=A0ABU6NFW5_9BACI|nr:MerR family transcriptional regulator [Shouchella miscanthi]MED4127106.1 MerR family transcriptional regulator [Shouchella miscanthi]
MTFKEGNYNIKAVSKKLGIRPGTLRAWERRYHVVAPFRNESGHRLYSEEQVLKLQTLIERVNEGFTIKQAVESLERKGTYEENASEGHHYIAQIAREIADALLCFDEERAQAVLNQAYSMYSIDRVTIDLFMQVEKQLEEMDKQPSMTNIHKQYMFQILGAKVKNVMLSIPKNNLMPKALLFSYQGDSYSILLRVFSFYLKRKGMDVICLDAGIPLEDVELVMEQIQPELMIISSMDRVHFEQAANHVRYVAEKSFIKKSGIIGDAFNGLTDDQKKHHADLFVGKSRADWELWLEHMN